MDIDAEHFGSAVLQEIGQRFAPFLPQAVVDAVRLNGVVAFEIQKRQAVLVASGVAFVIGRDVGADGFVAYGLS